MSVQAMSWVIDRSKQKGSPLLLLIMIANHAHADGTGAYPSVETLARECRLSERQIKRMLPELEASGELVVFWSHGRRSHKYAIPMGESNSDILSLLKIEYAEQIAAANHDILSPLTVTSCHGSEMPTVTFPTPNSDISDTPTVTNPDAHIKKNRPLEKNSEKNIYQTPNRILKAVPDPSEIEWTWPMKPLVDAFADYLPDRITPAMIGFVESAVRPGDEAAWSVTIEKYRMNFDPALNRYLPDKTGNLLDVFKKFKADQDRGRNGNGYHKTGPDMLVGSQERWEGIHSDPDPIPMRPAANVPLEQTHLWNAWLDRVRKHVNPQDFDTWFRGLIFDGLNDGKNALKVRARPHTCDWIRRYYAKMIYETLVECGIPEFTLDWEPEPEEYKEAIAA